MNLVELKNVDKTYALGATSVQALSNINLVLAEREFSALWGPSGSGKSTLLNLIGLLDRPSVGELYWQGHRLDRLSDQASAKLRNKNIGFIFQNFNLIPVLSALENVLLPLQIEGLKAQDKARAIALLEAVGLADKSGFRPDQLSGGQRQRVAIARALINQPKLVIADEPTANLDAQSSQQIIAIMKQLNSELGTTFIFSTHDDRLVSSMDRLIPLQDGRIQLTREGALA